MSSVTRRSACAAITTIGVLAAGAVGTTGVARASDTDLVTTLNSANTTILHDESAVEKGLTGYAKSHNAKPSITALRAEVSDIHALNAKLAKVHTSTSKGAAAKRDITQGLGLIANAYSRLGDDLARASASDPVSQSKVMSDLKLDKSGRTKLLAGIKLLS